MNQTKSKKIADAAIGFVASLVFNVLVYYLQLILGHYAINIFVGRIFLMLFPFMLVIINIVLIIVFLRYKKYLALGWALPLFALFLFLIYFFSTAKLIY